MKPKRPQTETATKRYQHGHTQLANEKSLGHGIFIITAEMPTS